MKKKITLGQDLKTTGYLGNIYFHSFTKNYYLINDISTNRRGLDLCCYNLTTEEHENLPAKANISLLVRFKGIEEKFEKEKLQKF